MTDMREALKPVLSFLDELAANAAPYRRKSLNPITIGGSAKLYAEGLRAALASAPGEPVAWGEFYGGVCKCVRLDKSVHCTEPLYRGASPRALDVEQIERIKKLLEAVRDYGGVATWRNEARELAVVLAKGSK